MQECSIFNLSQNNLKQTLILPSTLISIPNPLHKFLATPLFYMKCIMLLLLHLKMLSFGLLDSNETCLCIFFIDYTISLVQICEPCGQPQLHFLIIVGLHISIYFC